GDDDVDVVGLAGEGEGDVGATTRRGFAGVADEVEEDLASFAGDGLHGNVAGDTDVEGDLAAAEDGIETEADAFGGGAEVDALGSRGLAEEGERRAGDGEDAVGFCGGHAGEADDFGCGGVGLADEIEEVLDGFEGVADLVGDDDGHAAPVLELLRGEEVFLELGFFVFGAGEAGGVVVDAGGDGAEAADELEGDVGGEDSGQDVGPGVGPEDGGPGGDDLHEVGGAAGDDEEGEAGEEEDPVAGDDDAGAAAEGEKSDADGGVAEEGDRVGNDHGPDEVLDRKSTRLN